MKTAWCLMVLAAACATGDDDVPAAGSDARPGAPDANGGAIADAPSAPVDAPPGSPDAPRADAASTPDAAASCVAAATYPDTLFAADDQSGGVDSDAFGLRYWYWMGAMGAEAESVVLEVQLYPGYGAFAADAAPRAGTFPIAGDETTYLTCGVCVLLYADLVRDASGAIISANEFYLADGGSVTIDRVDVGPGAPDVRITGSFASLTFNEIDSFTAEPLLGGCRTTATHGSFDAPLDPGP